MNQPHTESYNEIPLFAGLNAKEVQEILALTRPRWFEPDEVIFKEGDNSNSLYLIEEGSVAVRKRLDGKDEVIANLDAKGIFGEMALTTDEPRAATIIATSKVQAGEIRCEDFDALLGKHSAAASKISLNIARVLSSRISHLLLQLNELSNTRGIDPDSTELSAFKKQVFSDWSF